MLNAQTCLANDSNFSVQGPDYTQNNYIATQGPLPNTIYEFWLMVQQNVRRAGTANQCCQKIAMLTDLVENGRQKCAAYFPVRLDDRLVVMNTARPGQEHLHKLTVDAEDRRPSTQLATFEGNCFVVQNQVSLITIYLTLIFLILIWKCRIVCVKGDHCKEWIYNTKAARSSIFRRWNGQG